MQFVACAIAGALVACSVSSPQPEATSVAVGVSSLQVAVASSDFQVGRPRLPIVLFDGPQRVADVRAVHLTAFDLGLEPRVPGWNGDAVNYSDYEVPYWVLYPELPNAGFWGFVAEITLADGAQTQAQFTIEAKEHSGSPAIGEAAPPSENRTLLSEPDIRKLTSGVDPIPALYQMTVADAVTSGRPTVVAIATPGFCTSQLCAPVVHSVEDVYGVFGDRANFIHIEVYKTFDPLVFADEVDEWGLDSEPWTFVLDRDGKVTAKFGGPLSPRELTEALNGVLQ
jgi:hypothetical protein